MTEQVSIPAGPVGRAIRRLAAALPFRFVDLYADSDGRDWTKPIVVNPDGTPKYYGTPGPTFRLHDFSDLAPPPDDGRFE